MKTTTKLLVALVAALALSAGCGPPPKVLVDAQFLGTNRTAKVLLRRSPEGQFDHFIRICSTDESAEEVNCKDTLVLENVIPGSLY